MFTGIIQCTGLVKEVSSSGKNKTFRIESEISASLKIDQSLSHSGVCLTVEEIGQGWHRVTAISETLKKTNLKNWDVGTIVNLERSLKMGDPLDGHMVQGHVDCRGDCVSIKEKKGSWIFTIEFPKKFNALVIVKGSIAMNGISLTVFSITKKSFRVAIIPYTYEHTNLRDLKKTDSVNLEFDMIGKYLNRRLSLE